MGDAVPVATALAGGGLIGLGVWAIRDGRDAAVQIEKYLQLKEDKNKSVVAA